MGGPSGTVTFLFSDVEGSTRLWESAPDAMRAALAAHDTIMRKAVERHDGYVFATGGDGFACAFSRAADAMGAARHAQAALGEEAWPAEAAIRVRMGLHTGEAEERDGDYFGQVVNRAARLMAIAHGGQVVCSSATAELPTGAELVDLGEHRLRDLSTPQRVFQIGGGAFPALRSPDVVPTNLPTMRTELIGRADDVATLSSLVERAQLVTLTGVGGVGKTRLALAIGATVAAGFADGCWLVELAPVADGAEVVKTVASVLGAPATDADGLARYLSDRRLLVVLDNCEHVLGDVADLVDAVLPEAPDAHVLATSREPLGLDGEHVRRVQSLDVPPADAAMDAVVGAPAVQLFAERAATVAEGFAVTEENLTAVVEICEHLDGIPLAIELAAARVRAMPVAEISARLGERFRLLAGGSRRAQERHRTLAAAVGWSHDLLSDAEKVVFRRLSVFPGSFDLAAAEAVAGEDGLDVLEHVVRLVDRSLVQYEPGAGRYRLLETLRQYGADRLVEAGETDVIRARHAEHFLAFVDRMAPAMLDARYPAACDALTTDLDNLRALADWCIERREWSRLLHMCEALHVFLFLTAPVDIARWYGQLPENGVGVDPQEWVDALGRYAYLTANMGDRHAVTVLAERSLGLADAAGLQPSPWAYLAQHQAATLLSDQVGGTAFSERALAAAEVRGDDLGTLIAMGAISVACAEQGDLETSNRHADEELRRCEALGQPALIMVGVLTAATNHLWSRGGDPDFASARDILARHDLHGYSDNATGTMWYDLAWAQALVGLHDFGAVQHLVSATRMADRHGAPGALDLSLRLLALVLAWRGRSTDAALVAAYCDANLQPFGIKMGSNEWVRQTLAGQLDAVPDRAIYEEAGRRATRHQIMTLVNALDGQSAVTRQTPR